ncbi:hypothetical protein Efla_000986 [Eimeria flavescens]
MGGGPPPYGSAHILPSQTGMGESFKPNAKETFVEERQALSLLGSTPKFEGLRAQDTEGTADSLTFTDLMSYISAGLMGLWTLLCVIGTARLLKSGAQLLRWVKQAQRGNSALQKQMHNSK